MTVNNSRNNKGQFPTGSIIRRDFTPEIGSGWLDCDGSTLSVEDYLSLFQVIGHEYGGTGSSFTLPTSADHIIRSDGSYIQTSVPDLWVANTNHTFEAGASSLLWRVRYGSDGYWAIVGRKNTNTAGTVNYTTDPTGTWSAPTSIGNFGTGEMIRTIAYSGSSWGMGGYSSDFSYKATPPSGSWTAYDLPSENTYGGDYGYGYWASGGDGPIIFYTNTLGGSWSTATEPFTSAIKCIQYGADGYWVAGGDGSSIATAYQVPSTFTTRTSPFDAGSTICNAAYGNGYWVIVGTTGQMAYQTTAPTGSWTVVDEPGPFTTSDTILNASYGNGIWTMVGSNGKIATRSSDPTGSWDTQTSGVTTNLVAVGYGNGCWVIGGYSGVLLYSSVTT